MKVMVRTIMKVFPGKIAEAMEFERKHMAIANRVLGISGKCYRPLSGGGDTMRTIVSEGEFDSLAAFEAHPEKMGADSEMRALMPKFEEVIESMEVEFYLPMP
ncbi:MAG: NIPSNAP family protein [Dehalococcoidia bacterium]|nr:NIPSNAP family protein [Dehalococcoidia bacterium]